MDDFSGLKCTDIDMMKLDVDDKPPLSSSRSEMITEKEADIEEVATAAGPSRDDNDDIDYQPREPSAIINPPPSATRSASSTSSTTSSTGSDDSSRNAHVSLKDYRYPSINYDKDNPNQLLAAVIGRQFDEPNVIVNKLQELISRAQNIKFIPFTIRRSVLIRGNFDWRDLKELDLIILSYNASEARILLMGPDGYYTQLIKRLEAVLGSNKIAFVVTHYLNECTTSLISGNLKGRLMMQAGLERYLERDQVLSWYQDPCDGHVTKLIQLANSENNPENYCNII